MYLKFLRHNVSPKVKDIGVQRLPAPNNEYVLYILYTWDGSNTYHIMLKATELVLFSARPIF